MYEVNKSLLPLFVVVHVLNGLCVVISGFVVGRVAMDVRSDVFLFCVFVNDDCTNELLAPK